MNKNFSFISDKILSAIRNVNEFDQRTLLLIRNVTLSISFISACNANIYNVGTTRYDQI